MEQLELVPQRRANRLDKLDAEQLNIIGAKLVQWKACEPLLCDDDMAKVFNHRTSIGHPDAPGFYMNRNHVSRGRLLHGLPARGRQSQADRERLALHLAVMPAAPVTADTAPEAALPDMPIQQLVMATMDAYAAVGRFIDEFKRRARLM